VIRQKADDDLADETGAKDDERGAANGCGPTPVPFTAT